MRVLLRFVWHIPVDHHRDILNVQSARAHIRANEYWDHRRPEQRQRAEALALRQARVQGGAPDGEGFEQVREVRRRMGPSTEDDCRWRLERNVGLRRCRRFLMLRLLRFGFLVVICRLWRSSAKMAYRFWGIAQQMIEVRFSNMGWNQDVVLLERVHRLNSGLLSNIARN